MINENKILKVDISLIATNPWNPHNSSTEDLARIIHSIGEVGQLVPLLLVEYDIPLLWNGQTYDVPTDKQFLLIDGEQRFKALTRRFLDGDNDSLIAKAILVGKLSDYEPWELAEIGQIANHTRGKLENDEKTGELISEIAKHKDLDAYLKLVNQPKEYVNKALAMAKSRTNDGPNRVHKSQRPEGIPKPSSNRGYCSVVLPFETEDDVAEFESLLMYLPEEGKTFKGLERSYRLLSLLRQTKGIE